MLPFARVLLDLGGIHRTEPEDGDRDLPIEAVARKVLSRHHRIDVVNPLLAQGLLEDPFQTGNQIWVVVGRRRELLFVYGD